LLASMGAQVFITCIDRRDIDDLWPESGRDRMALFHVEHGTVQQGAPEPAAVSTAGTRRH